MTIDCTAMKAACIETFAALPRVSAEAATAYANKGQAMAARVTQELAAREDIDRLIGPGNQAMMADNHKNHARFIASVLLGEYPGQFLETILWVYRAYRAHGFHLTYWPSQLNAWLFAMENELPGAAYQEIEPLYVWMLNNQAAFVTLSELCPSAWEMPHPQQHHGQDA